MGVKNGEKITIDSTCGQAGYAGLQIFKLFAPQDLYSEITLHSQAPP